MLWGMFQKPKNWRLACQLTVGKKDSRGLVCAISLLFLIFQQTGIFFSLGYHVIIFYFTIGWIKCFFFLLMQLVVQQLPEWKGHEWNYERISPEELASELELNFGSESS